MSLLVPSHLTCLLPCLVSLACPISSDVLINAKCSEESLVNESMICAPVYDAGLPFAPIAVLSTAELPICACTRRRAAYRACHHPAAGARCAHCIRKFSAATSPSSRDLFHQRSLLIANCLDAFDTIVSSSGHHPRGQPPTRQQPSALTISSRRCFSRAKNLREHTVGNYSCSVGANCSCRAEHLAQGISKGSPTETWLNVRAFVS